MDIAEFFATPDIERLGIVGSRDWPSLIFVKLALAKVLLKYPTITTLVSGGQPKGVDGWVPGLAREFDLAYTEHPPAHYYPEDDPRYRPYHPSHYHERNRDIVEDVDILMAFRWQKSRGTASTLSYARHRLASEFVLLYDASSREDLLELINDRNLK
jgi:hypothetical protein